MSKTVAQAKVYPMYPTTGERQFIDQMCVEERRRVSDVVRNILEDILDGRIVIDDVREDRIERSPLSVRLKPDFMARLDAFRSTRDNISMDRIMHRALKVLAARRAGKEQNP